MEENFGKGTQGFFRQFHAVLSLLGSKRSGIVVSCCTLIEGPDPCLNILEKLSTLYQPQRLLNIIVQNAILLEMTDVFADEGVGRFNSPPCLHRFPAFQPTRKIQPLAG